MALPKIDVRVHEKYLVGIGKTVKFRPYKIKEQKILLEAKEEHGEDAETKQRQALIQVMQLCVLDDTVVENLPIFDFVTLFIALRAKSVNEIATVKYQYDWEDGEGRPQQSELVVNINLEDIGVVVPEGVSDTVMINETTGIKLKYPSIGFLAGNPSDEDVILESIEYVFDDESVHDSFSKDELRDFIESLEIKVLLKIEEFLSNPPRVEHVEHVVLDDGEETDIVFNTLPDFFL